MLAPVPWGSNRDPIWLLQGAVLSLLLLTAVWVIPGERWRQTFDRYRWPLLLLAGWLAFGLLQLVPLPGAGSVSLDVFASATVWLQSVLLCLLLLLVLVLLERPSRLAALALAMVLAGFVQAFYGSLMVLSGTEWLVLEKKTYGIGLATGTFVNRNHLAGLLNTCLALGVGLLVGQVLRGHGAAGGSGVRRFLKWLFGPQARLRLMLVVLVIGLVLTHSRMGNAGFFLSLGLVAVLALWRLRPLPRGLLVLLLTLVLVDLAVVGSWFGFEQVVARMTETGQSTAESTNLGDVDRLNISRETLAAARDYLWLGSGGGTFEQLFPAYRPVDLRKTYDHAHNDYLEFLLEYGLVGSAFLLGFAALALRSAWRALNRRRNPLLRGLALGGLMACAAAALQAWVDFNLHIPACAAFLMLTLALMMASERVPTPVRKSVNF
ncbi:MAG: O-antigen ligase family protein [Pseudomonadota bacterium]